MTSPRATASALDVYSQGAPFTYATATRILKTTAISVSMPAGHSWDAGCAQFSAVSVPDPTTGQQYFCLIVDGAGIRYDFTLTPVHTPGHPDSLQGGFVLTGAGGSITEFTGWTYVIDPTSDQHYFVCSASTDLGNGLYWSCLTQTYKFIPPMMETYEPSAGSGPQGVWSIGDTIWFTKGDNSLWQVAFADMLAGTTTSLQQIGSTGIVQAVISDGAAPPTCYVLAAVANGGSYDLVEFPAGSPANAVTIQSGFSPGGLKTTPDGAIWNIVPDLSQSDLKQPKSQVAMLVPSYPVNGRTPAWVDPFAGADPSLYAAGTTQSIMDAFPLSATDVVLLTTPNASTYVFNQFAPATAWQMTRVAIGVFDQPAVPFNAYTGDTLSAYTQISQDLIKADSNANDIRALYGQISSSQASQYYAALSTMTAPSTFSDTAAWTSVQNDVLNELGDLVSTSSFWDSMSQVVSIQNQINSMAVGYVANSLAIPTTATLIDTTAGTVNALNIAALGAGSGASILTCIGGFIAVSAAADAATLGLFSAGAAIVGMLCSFFGSRATNYTINVSDPMYFISAKLGEVDGVLGQNFTETLNTIQSYAQANAKDGGMLAAVGSLYRNGTWTATPPQFEPGSSQPPSSFQAYYNDCVLSLLPAFVPLVTAMDYTIINEPGGAKWNTFKGKPVYVSPAHTFWDTQGNEYQGALLQYASKSDQSKPLGQDLDALLFTTWNIPYAEVFQQWNISEQPSWIS
ncbi:hypothetical protein IC762_28210 [Bradyrhizobium genosp. L]|uniref:hypothetical protein n=1 Tax=Bradyrhizobium genosp. L TaxID=83637 RepID=UPI0018A2A8C7|nr:hypothetical protein [Bradyrhizobium genosp. L]QPF83556.1 hypothetical protein IC762_28210 [Bradyrhizobium genosp. L]